MLLHKKASSENTILKELKINCQECRGLCCTALYFSASDGFPKDKDAGEPCPNLLPDFRCSIHQQLLSRQMKGCIAYDCCGAGQIVTGLFKEKNQSSEPELFSLFIKVSLMQQILWYLFEASHLIPANSLLSPIQDCMNELRAVSHSNPKTILDFNLAAFREKANPLLKESGKLVRNQTYHTHKTYRKNDFMGFDFKKANLNGMDFSLSLLIATNLEGCSLCGTNFLGADLRDANIRDADLKESIFLTQGQLNSAKGNENTRIPETLERPVSWV